MAELVQRNQVWKAKAAHGSELRVMGMAEGWIMVRHKGAGPFLLTERDLRADWERVTPPTRDKP